jgi:hypothetical protein
MPNFPPRVSFLWLHSFHVEVFSPPAGGSGHTPSAEMQVFSEVGSDQHARGVPVSFWHFKQSKPLSLHVSWHSHAFLQHMGVSATVSHSHDWQFASFRSLFFHDVPFSFPRHCSEVMVAHFAGGGVGAMVGANDVGSAVGLIVGATEVGETVGVIVGATLVGPGVASDKHNPWKRDCVDLATVIATWSTT